MQSCVRSTGWFSSPSKCGIATKERASSEGLSPVLLQELQCSFSDSLVIISEPAVENTHLWSHTDFSCSWDYSKELRAWVRLLVLWFRAANVDCSLCALLWMVHQCFELRLLYSPPLHCWAARLLCPCLPQPRGDLAIRVQCLALLQVPSVALVASPAVPRWSICMLSAYVRILSIPPAWKISPVFRR